MKTKRIFGLLGLMIAMFTSHSMNYQGDYVDNLLGLGNVRINGVYTNEDEELQGLAAALQSGKTADGLRRINNIQKIRAERNKKLLQVNITKGQRNLVGKMENLSEDAQADIRGGKVKFTDRFVYFTKGFLSMTNIVEMIDSSDTVGTGYSNLSKGGEVPKGLNMSVDYIAIMVNDYDTGASPAETIFTNVWNAAAEKAEWQNAEFEIFQDGSVIFQGLINEFIENRIHEGANPNGPNAIYAGKNLKSELIIKAGAVLQFKIKFASGVSVTPGTGVYTGVRILMQGDGTGYRS
jgi:hypothetical protein